MGKCIKCGVYEIWNKRTCKYCIDEWKNKRLEAYRKVVNYIGEPNSQNLKQFNKLLKRYERKLTTHQAPRPPITNQEIK